MIKSLDLFTLSLYERKPSKRVDGFQTEFYSYALPLEPNSRILPITVALIASRPSDKFTMDRKLLGLCLILHEQLL